MSNNIDAKVQECDKFLCRVFDEHVKYPHTALGCARQLHTAVLELVILLNDQVESYKKEKKP